MRVISWNTQFGSPNSLSWDECGLGPVCTPSQTPDLADSVRALGELEADVLAFQEVDRGQGRSGWGNQPAQIAAALRPLGYRWWHFAPAYVGAASFAHLPAFSAWSKWAPAFGVMLVAKQCPRRWKVANLGRGPVQWVERDSGFAGRWLGGYPRFGQKRILLAADFGSVAVGVTHLELDMDTARSQLRRAWDLTRSLAPAAVIVGDFNMRQQQVCEELDPGSAYAGGVCTYPATAPTIGIDHAVYTAHPQVQAQVSVQQLPVSDHAALVIDLPHLGSKTDLGSGADPGAGSEPGGERGFRRGEI